MARWLLILLVFVICNTQPAYCKDFLAVYSTRDFYQYKEQYDQYQPEIYYSDYDWNGFELFLLETRLKTKPGQRVVVDIQCHGYNYYAICATTKTSDNWEDWDICTARWLFNKIDKYLGDRDLVVICEACYGGYVYAATMDHPVSYPVYGNRHTCRGWNNYALAQYYRGLRITLVDLRMYDYYIPNPKTREPEGVVCDREVLLINYMDAMYMFGL